MATGLIIANHLFAAVHAARRAGSSPDAEAAAPQPERAVEFGLVLVPQGTAVSLTHRF